MRSTCSLYIDAGYLLAAAATRVTGTSLRSGIHADYAKLISSLVSTAEDRSGLPVLRVHWYDSANRGIPDAQQERIGELPKVKLRLGRFGMDGHQKGVDLRIGLDLVAHARNAASDVFFLISGDDDLTEAVEEAQVHGVQVVVLAVPTDDGKPHGVSRHLILAADELDQIEGAAIDGAVLKVEVPRRNEVPVVPTPVVSAPVVSAPAGNGTAAAVSRGVPSPLDVAALTRSTPTPVAPAARLAYTSCTGRASRVLPGDETDEVDEQLVEEVVDRVLASFRKSASPEDLLDLQRARPSIPRDIDRALLLDASDAMDIYDLSESTRYRLRARFWERYDEPPGPATDP